MQTIRFLTIGLLLGAAVAAAQPCSPADLRGRYLFRMWGWHDLGPNHPALPNTMGPFYALGVVTLDGAGKGSGWLNATLGGVVQTLDPTDFQYTVGENCSGTVTYRLEVAETNTVLGPDKQELRILDDGARVSGLVTESPGRGAILVSEFRRLGRGERACYGSMIRGTYAMKYEGGSTCRPLSRAGGPLTFLLKLEWVWCPSMGRARFTAAPFTIGADFN